MQANLVNIAYGQQAYFVLNKLDKKPSGTLFFSLPKCLSIVQNSTHHSQVWLGHTFTCVIPNKELLQTAVGETPS